MLYQCAFNLEGADAVTGGDNHIVGTAHEPIVAVLVFVSFVTSKVPITHERTVHRFLILPVFLEQANRALRFDLDRYLTFFANWDFITLFVHHSDGKSGCRLTHGAGTNLVTAEVTHQQDCLRLAVAVVDHQSGAVFPLLHNLRVERFAGTGAVAQVVHVVLA